MVSWETNDKNPSLETFYLQPRERSRAFRRNKSPEPKNSISYRDTPWTEDAGAEKQGRVRLLEGFPVFPYPVLPFSFAHKSLVPVCTDLTHFLINFFLLHPPSCRLNSVECKRIEDGSEMLPLSGREDHTSTHKIHPLEITWEKLYSNSKNK